MRWCSSAASRLTGCSRLIHCPPGIVALAPAGEQHLVHLPLVTGPRASAMGLVGIRLATCAAPCTDGLRGHDDSTFKQERFDIAKARAASQVASYSVADALHRTVGVLGDGGMP